MSNSLDQAWKIYYQRITEADCAEDAQEAVSAWTSAVQEEGLQIINFSEYGCVLSDGQVFSDPARAPTEVVLVPEEKPVIRRAGIGIKIFLGEADFLEWQKEEPREIFEITPLMTVDAFGAPIIRMAVTYNLGVIT